MLTPVITKRNDVQVDISDRFISGSISKSLSDASALLSFDCHSIVEKHAMNFIDLVYDSNKLFSGVIKEQKDDWNGIKFSSFDAIDYIDIMHNRLVAETYEEINGPYLLKDIITEIMAKYMPEVTTNNVKDIKTEVEGINFNYVPLFQAVQDLARISNAHFYIDNDLDLHFFQRDDGTSGKTYNNSNVLTEGIDIQSVATDLVNRVWVFGAKQAAIEYKEEYFTLDGKNRIFKLGYEPNYISVFIDDVEQTIKLEKNDDGSANFLYNKQDKLVFLPDRETIPASGELKIRYRPTTEIVDFFEDPQSIETYGLYEKAIKDKKITEKLAARKRARTEMRRAARIKRIIGFKTRDFDIDIGKTAQITLPNFDIDNIFIITEIKINLEPNNVVAEIKAEEVI